ncbi:hypothetical protein EDD17DRAFT_1210550 [Pisolithus thermaeus]|nr:hypothetical protein EDD17DRAFT_1210550 [Pisolithus thermaeus]
MSRRNDPLVTEIQPPHAAVHVLPPYMYADNNLHAYWRSVLYAALANGNEINLDPPHYLIEWVMLRRSSNQRKLHLKLTNELDADDLLMLNTSDPLSRELQDCYASVVLDRIPVYPLTSAGPFAYSSAWHCSQAASSTSIELFVPFPVANGQ